MRKLYLTKTSEDFQDTSYLLLDNDFLSELYSDKEVYASYKENLKNPSIIDPLVEFEFLRSVFLPKQLELKEKFIQTSLFNPATNHHEIFQKIQINALLLSKIYAHNSIHSPSLVDIHLAARAMFHSPPMHIISGNKKDFPSCIFNVSAVVMVMQSDEVFKPYYILQFSKKNLRRLIKNIIKSLHSYGEYSSIT